MTRHTTLLFSLLSLTACDDAPAQDATAPATATSAPAPTPQPPAAEPPPEAPPESPDEAAPSSPVGAPADPDVTHTDAELAELFGSSVVLPSLPVDAHPTRLPEARFESRPLRRALTLRSSLARARRAAATGRGGTYRWAAFRLRSDELATQLRASVEVYLSPSPMDIVYYAQAEATPPAADAFDTGADFEGAERAAAEQLAEAIRALVAAHPDMRTYRVHGGWADAVGGAYHGVAIVDPDTREALWLFAEATWDV